MASRISVRLAVSLVLLCGCVAAQAPAPPRSFEVASIRMVGEDAGFTVFPKLPSAHFTAENISLKLLIAIAYQTADNVVLAPEWMSSQRYTVTAKPEGEAELDFKQYAPMLRKLLEDRLHLKAHREMRQVSGYALIAPKGAAKLEAAPLSDAVIYILSNGIRSPGASMHTLAGLLSRPVGKPVVDETGIAGTYKIQLSFAPLNAQDSDLPSIYSAVQEQLGLRLEPKKVPQEYIVVDSADRVPTEN